MISFQSLLMFRFVATVFLTSCRDFYQASTKVGFHGHVYVVIRQLYGT